MTSGAAGRGGGQDGDPARGDPARGELAGGELAGRAAGGDLAGDDLAGGDAAGGDPAGGARPLPAVAWPSGPPDPAGPAAAPAGPAAAAAQPVRTARPSGLLPGLAAAAIIVSLVLIVVVCAGGGWPDVAAGRLARPPWVTGLHLRPVLAVWCLWAAAACGAGGVAAGLAAVARGGRVPARALVCAAAVATVALVALPPAGSTDALDYAAYGRIAELGHSPYQMSPLRLARIGDPFGRAAPKAWDTHVSVYGPLATAEQLTAARLGARSISRAMFWLKLFNALAFGAVAVAADRLLRGQPSRRARAHLLWTANPLLIWGLIAGAHVDAVAAMLGFLGLAVAVVRPGARGPAWPLALAAGLLTGAAAAVKVNFLLFAVALAWACRRSGAALAAAAAGLAAVALPLYAWTGPAAVRAVLRRAGYATIDSGYALVFGRAHQRSAAELLLTVLAGAAVAALLLWRPPPGSQRRPAVRTALLLSVAWLLIWPYQLPWYDTMAFCLLLLVPASALDWLLLARLLAGSVALMTPLWAPPHIGALHKAAHWVALTAAPVVLIAVAAAAVALAVSGRWAAWPSWPPSPPAARTGPAP